MKRINNLYEQIYNIYNLQKADQIASLGKTKTYGVIQHRKQQDYNLFELHKMLRDKTYRTSTYDVFTIHDPKERIVYRLPYFPDRICHHAVMNILEPIFVKTFTSDTYSCIKGRGIHACMRNLNEALKTNPKYCLKLDIRKFYPNVNHDILKALLRKKFKDQDLLRLLDEIIDSAPGLPIGNYLSQHLANFYLSYFDHWLKEVKGVKHYFRYADDMIILSDNKEELHHLRIDITKYLKNKLDLDVKDNYQVFPIEERGIDFIGYVFRSSHVRLRKRIKQRMVKAIRRNKPKSSIAAYTGWAKHCDSINLMRKLNGKAR